MRRLLLAALLLAACSKSKRPAALRDGGGAGRPPPTRGETLGALAYLPASARTVIAVDVRGLLASPFADAVHDFLASDHLVRAVTTVCGFDPLQQLDWAAFTLAPLGDRKLPTEVVHVRFDAATLEACGGHPSPLAAETLPSGQKLFVEAGTRDRTYAFVAPGLLVSGDRAWIVALLGGGAGGSGSAAQGVVAERASQMDTSKTGWVVAAELPRGKAPANDRPTWLRGMFDLATGFRAGAVLGFDSPVDANEVTQQLRARVKQTDLAAFAKSFKFEPVGERVYVTVDLTPAQTAALFPSVALLFR